MKVSIIVTTWNKTQFMAACGMACIQSIRAFTDPKDYELIVIETADNFPLWDDHKSLGLEDCTYIQKTMEQDQGNSADMNEGAKLATGEYLCFVENDIIFHPNWLENMVYYLDNDIADVIIPCQYHATWDRKKKWEKNLPDKEGPDEGYNPGIEESGVLLIKKDKFDSIGGWDEQMKRCFMWKAFMRRAIGLRIITTYKTWITHIGGVSYWWSAVNDKENFDKQTREESKLL